MNNPPGNSTPTPSINNNRIPGFGARLRRLRKSAGMKQSHLAFELGVNQATVSRWENGSIAPSPIHAEATLRVLQPVKSDDSSLRRLVESSTLMVHLVTDIDHILLAASPAREAKWGRSAASLRGKSVWGAASHTIQQAESSLESRGWWDCTHPEPVEVELDAYDNGFLPILPGLMLWERMWLSDGRPARLCTMLR